MIKINAQEFLNAIESAAVGAGKGFVLIIDPEERDIGNRKKAQVASISSSDGTKTGITNFYIKTDEKEGRTISVSANLRPAAASLSKVTEWISMELHGSFISLSDEKQEAEVRVEILEKPDIVLELPNKPDETITFSVNREKFAAAVRMGGYCAGDSLGGQNSNCICFHVDTDAKELWVASMRIEAVCRGIVSLEQVFDYSDGSMKWHLVNHQFLKRMMSQLTGDQIQVAFNPKYMVVQCATAMFGSKKSEGTFAEFCSEMLSETGYDFCGKVAKKDLLLGMEIAQVGAEEACLLFETGENGMLKLTQNNGSNKATVIQREHEGQMPCTCYACELIKMLMASNKEETLFYFGNTGGTNVKSFLRFSGESEGVRYNAVIAPINRKREDRQKKKEN